MKMLKKPKPDEPLPFSSVLCSSCGVTVSNMDLYAFTFALLRVAFFGAALLLFLLPALLLPTAPLLLFPLLWLPAFPRESAGPPDEGGRGEKPV